MPCFGDRVQDREHRQAGIRIIVALCNGRNSVPLVCRKTPYQTALVFAKDHELIGERICRRFPINLTAF
jgi:hypothetical protein